MGYGFVLRGSREASAQAEALKAKVLRCLRRLTSQAGEIPRCCRFFKRSSNAALISHHFPKGEAGSRLIAPGQLKSLGTDAFIAFGFELSREVR